VQAIDRGAFDGIDVEGRAVLVHTGWDAHWRTPRYFEAHPYLTHRAAERLLTNGAALVGIDSLNIDDTSGGERPVHSTLLGGGIPIVEHLCGLSRVPDSEVGAAERGEVEQLAVIPGDDHRDDRDEGAPREGRGAASGRGHGRKLTAQARAMKGHVPALVGQDPPAGGAEQRVVAGERQNPAIAQRDELGGQQHADLAAQTAAVAQHDEGRVRPVRLQPAATEALAQGFFSQRACCCSSRTNSSIERA